MLRCAAVCRRSLLEMEGAAGACLWIFSHCGPTYYMLVVAKFGVKPQVLTPYDGKFFRDQKHKVSVPFGA